MSGYGAVSGGGAESKQKLSQGDFDPLLNQNQPSDSAGPAQAPSQPNKSRGKKNAAAASSVRHTDGVVQDWSIADYCIACCSLFLAFGALFMFAWMLVVGLENDNTNCERPLWIWLVVCGGYGGGVIVLYGIGLIAYTYYEKRGSSGSRLVYCCDELFLPLIVKVLSVLFGSAWMIVGSVWAYAIDPDDTQCPGVLYNWCWYYLTVAWGVLGGGIALFLCGFACVSGYLMCVGRKHGNTSDDA